LKKSKHLIALKVFPISFPSYKDRQENIRVIDPYQSEKATGAIMKVIEYPGVSIMVFCLEGALSFIYLFDKECVINMLEKRIPRKLDKNIAAFRAGYETAEGMEK